MTQVACVSLGHLTSFDAGLGEFTRRLGEGLARRAGAWRARDVRLCFHLHSNLHGAFGSDVDYVVYAGRQRWLPWRLADCVLWHNTFQHNISRPPGGVKRRLLTVHDLNYRYRSPGPGAWRDEAWTRLAIAHSDQLVSISRYVGEDVRRHLHWKGALETIYNGASDLSRMPQSAVAELVGKRFFFHVSRMAPSKNVGAIVELARAWPERIFVLAGPAWGHSKQLHDELAGALPNLRILLGIDDATKGWLLAHCDAFLFPSLTEGFGLPPLEAMYFGKPVFLSDRTCLPEIGGDDAGYFREFSAAGMRSVIEQELPRLSARQDAIRRRAATFDWERCVDAYAALYDRVLARTGPPAQQGDAVSAR